MAKFVMIQDSCDFEKVKRYVKDILMTKFYITPKLMNAFINDFNLKCIIGLNIDGIKPNARSKVDLVCTSVYNKVFQNDAVRVDAIKINGTICQLAQSIDDVNVIFGLEEEYADYWCPKCEKL